MTTAGRAGRRLGLHKRSGSSAMIGVQHAEVTMYQELIDAFILERDTKRQEERGSDAGEWHPSSLSNECQRQAVYSYIGEPVTNPRQIRNVRIMDRGTEMHEFIQNVVAAKHPGFLSEVKVNAYGGRIKGSSDGLLPVSDGVDEDFECEYHDQGEMAGSCHCDDAAVLQPVYELQEYKSISPMGKRYLKGKPKPDHAKQARIYYMGLKEMGYLLDGIRIVYVDRDDWSVLEFEVEPWDEVEEGTFLTEIDVLDNHVEEGTLPERMPNGYWLCDYCPYFNTCKG